MRRREDCRSPADALDVGAISLVPWAVAPKAWRFRRARRRGAGAVAEFYARHRKADARTNRENVTPTPNICF